MVLVRKEYNSYNKNIYQYIIKQIILLQKSNTCLSTKNNKNHIKISIISIDLSLLFYCYLSIVKPQWLLDSYLKNYFLWLVSFLISFSCILKISNQVILNLSSLWICCFLSKYIIGFIDLLLFCSNLVHLRNVCLGYPQFTRLTEVLLNSTTIPYIKSIYNIEISDESIEAEYPYTTKTQG